MNVPFDFNTANPSPYGEGKNKNGNPSNQDQGGRDQGETIATATPGSRQAVKRSSQRSGCQWLQRFIVYVACWGLIPIALAEWIVKRLEVRP